MTRLEVWYHVKPTFERADLETQMEILYALLLGRYREGKNSVVLILSKEKQLQCSNPYPPSQIILSRLVHETWLVFDVAKHLKTLTVVPELLKSFSKYNKELLDAIGDEL